MTVICLVARSSCFSLNLLAFRLYGVVFFRRMSETEYEPQHFGHGVGARHAPTKPRFPTFWGGKRNFAHSALCLGAPPVVNNSGNSVAAGKVRLLKRSSEHKYTMNRQRDGFVLWAMRHTMRNFALAFACRMLLFHVKQYKLRFFGALPANTKLTETSVAARERKAFLSIVTPVEVFCQREWVMRLV